MRISPLISLLLLSVFAFAEGSRELAPNENIIITGTNTTDVAALLIDNAEYNSFASYTNPDPNSRLYIHIADPASECIFLGFTFGHVNQTSMNPMQIDFEYRIVDPNGNVVFGPVQVLTTGGNITGWNDANVGPMQIYGAGGYDAMQVTSANLTSQGWAGAGDYYIEFDYAGSGTGLLIDFWDISVADCTESVLEEKKGRVWSYNWAIFAINDFGFPQRPFNGAFYVCAPDPDNEEAAFITKIDFNGAGFQPAAFNVAFNSFGAMNTGMVMSDRRSVQGANSTQAEYAVFLNDPVDLCITAEPGEIELLGISRCDGEEYCIKYIASKEGQIDLLLDFDGPDDVYTPGSADIMIAVDVAPEEVGVPTCVYWDGLDGMGVALDENAGTSIPVVISYAQGIYHFPIYDAEFMMNGFRIEAVRPPGPIPLLYYDDSQISVASGSGEPAVQLTGCNTPCHRWNVFNDPNIPGFGNLNTINSWWFSQRIVRSEVFFLPAYIACSINGPENICEGETAMLTWDAIVQPDGAPTPETVSVDWTGPDILGSTQGSGIMVGSAGTYEATVTWLTPLGDTCYATCEQVLTELPITYGAFDTLIVSGDEIEINGELFSEGGQFVQVLTGSNGCDSILTIRISLLQTAVHFNLDDCNSYPSIGTDSIYTEFTPEYPDPLTCATLEATVAYRENPGVNKHSCTPGVNDSPAMCISSLDDCTYQPGDERSFVFEVTVTPAMDTAVVITGLNFWERAPVMYDWIDGPTGPNNYPTLYGVRVLKDGMEIFSDFDIPATTDWSFESFDFLGDDEFTVDAQAVFRFELLGYCLIGNGEPVAAWDLDEISVVASCALSAQMMSNISGRIFTGYGERIADVEVLLSEEPTFTNPLIAISSEDGEFDFPDNPAGNPYYLKAVKNTDYKEGVSTLDAIRIQKHLLGLRRFDSPLEYLAADVTGNSAVSILDILDVRKLVLGIIDEFPGNASWRFGKAGQTLPLSDPWNMVETITIPSLGDDLDNVNFVAIKIGDVNGSINGLNSVVATRSGVDAELIIEDRYVEKGETVVVPVIGKEVFDMIGMQFALQVSDGRIVSVQNGGIDVTDAYALSQNGALLKMSWMDVMANPFSRNTTLMSLVIEFETDGYLSNLIDIANTDLRGEVYGEYSETVFPIHLAVVPKQAVSAQPLLLTGMPNPFADELTLSFMNATEGLVNITISDISGKLVFRDAINCSSGEQRLILTRDQIGEVNGLLFCRVESAGQAEVIRIIRLR